MRVLLGVPVGLKNPVLLEVRVRSEGGAGWGGTELPVSSPNGTCPSTASTATGVGVSRVGGTEGPAAGTSRRGRSSSVSSRRPDRTLSPPLNRGSAGGVGGSHLSLTPSLLPSRRVPGVVPSATSTVSAVLEVTQRTQSKEPNWYVYVRTQGDLSLYTQVLETLSPQP